MTNIKSFMWIQSSNPAVPDCYIVNNRMIDVSENELRMKAAGLQLLDIKPNIVERLYTNSFNHKQNRRTEMKSSVVKGIVYQSDFIEERTKGVRLNYFYWCAPSEHLRLDTLLLKDAALINKHIEPDELKFIKSTTRLVVTYRAVLLFVALSILIIILILL